MVSLRGGRGGVLDLGLWSLGVWSPGLMAGRRKDSIDQAGVVDRDVLVYHRRGSGCHQGFEASKLRVYCCLARWLDKPWL